MLLYNTLPLGVIEAMFLGKEVSSSFLLYLPPIIWRITSKFMHTHIVSSFHLGRFPQKKALRQKCKCNWFV